MWVSVTDYLGKPTVRVSARQRGDTAFGFTADVPNVLRNIFDGYEVQFPSRYVIATQE